MSRAIARLGRHKTKVMALVMVIAAACTWMAVAQPAEAFGPCCRIDPYGCGFLTCQMSCSCGGYTCYANGAYYQSGCALLQCQYSTWVYQGGC
jgi:hypothetical protein